MTDRAPPSPGDSIHRLARAVRLGGTSGVIVLLAALAVVWATACGDGSTAAVQTPTGAGSALGGGYPEHRDAGSGISVILGTPDLAVGRHRVAFVLSDAEGLVRLPLVRVASYAPGAADTPAESASAQFYEFPLGVRGIFVATLEFDRPGEWQLDVQVPRPDGTVPTLRFPFEVAERTRAPAVGDPAPRSTSRTLDDVDSIEDLSTGVDPDPAVYALSIDEALDLGRPLVVVFASPGFCTNALCGPQAEMLTELREVYAADANFIHVDLFENPQELRAGDLDVAIRTPLLAEWGLATDEWTFIVGADGRITHRFEAFTPRAELEPALRSVLGD